MEAYSTTSETEPQKDTRSTKGYAEVKRLCFLCLFVVQKTKCAASSKLKAAQSVVPKVSRSFLQDGSASMYTLKLPDLYPDD
jgi:hypothetical protein